MVSNETTAPGMLRLTNDENKETRDIQMFSFELEKEDVMRFKPIYEAIHQFLMEEGYTHAKTGDDLVEDLYWERWVPSGAKEQHIWWRVAKEFTPYLRHFLIINFQTLNVTKAEVAYKNKKVSGEKTDVTIRAFGYIQWDYNDKFKNSFAWQMRRVFFSKMYSAEYTQKKGDILRFQDKFVRLIKGYFEMVSESPTPIIPQPPMGYKELS
jgi:hypothetical protein